MFGGNFPNPVGADATQSEQQKNDPTGPGSTIFDPGLSLLLTGLGTVHGRVTIVRGHVLL